MIGVRSRAAMLDARTGLLDRTLRRLLGPAEPEVGCDACFDKLDRYVELASAGVATPTRRYRGCGRTSTAARHAARSTSFRALVTAEQTRLGQ
jgi:hypothetical protein